MKNVQTWAPEKTDVLPKDMVEYLTATTAIGITLQGLLKIKQGYRVMKLV